MHTLMNLIGILQSRTSNSSLRYDNKSSAQARKIERRCAQRRINRWNAQHVSLVLAQRDNLHRASLTPQKNHLKILKYNYYIFTL